MTELDDGRTARASYPGRGPASEATAPDLTEARIQFTSSPGLRDKLFGTEASVSAVSEKSGQPPSVKQKLTSPPTENEVAGPNRRLETMALLEASLGHQELAQRGTERQLSLLTKKPGSETVENWMQQESYLLDLQKANVAAIRSVGTVAEDLHSTLLEYEASGTAQGRTAIRCKKAFNLLECPTLISAVRPESGQAEHAGLIQAKSQALLILSDPDRTDIVLRSMPEGQRLQVLEQTLALFDSHDEFKTYTAALQITAALKELKPQKTEMGISFGPDASSLLEKAKGVFKNAITTGSAPCADSRGMLKLLVSDYGCKPDVFAEIAENTKLAADVRAGAACLASGDCLYILDDLCKAGSLSANVRSDAIRYLVANKYQPFLERIDGRDALVSDSIMDVLLRASRDNPRVAQAFLSRLLKEGVEIPEKFWFVTPSVIRSLGEPGLDVCAQKVMSEPANKLHRGNALLLLAEVSPVRAVPLAEDLIINLRKEGSSPSFQAMQVILNNSGEKRLMEVISNIRDPAVRTSVQAAIADDLPFLRKNATAPIDGAADVAQVEPGIHTLPQADPALEGLLKKMRTDQSSVIRSFIELSKSGGSSGNTMELELQARALAAHGTTESMKALAEAWKRDCRPAGMAIHSTPGALEKFIGVLEQMPRQGGLRPQGSC